MNTELAPFIPLIVPIVAAMCALLLQGPKNKKIRAIQDGEEVLKTKISPMYFELINFWSNNKNNLSVDNFNSFVDTYYNSDMYKIKDVYIAEFLSYWGQMDDRLRKNKIIEFSIYIEKQYWVLYEFVSHQYIREKNKQTQSLFFTITSSLFHSIYSFMYYVFTYLTWIVIIMLYLWFFDSVNTEFNSLIMILYIFTVVLFIFSKLINHTLEIINSNDVPLSKNILYTQLISMYDGKKLSIKTMVLIDTVVKGITEWIFKLFKLFKNGPSARG
ncbi:hypothetical protein [Oceanobacillus sp. 1P07AA]|uniref:hypothetical protein n=1 Tax=Oceanobacillus sp. 1P07AA TaxID=3132293 RepID=UPI0039A507BC